MKLTIIIIYIKHVLYRLSYNHFWSSLLVFALSLEENIQNTKRAKNIRKTHLHYDEGGRGKMLQQ